MASQATAYWTIGPFAGALREAPMPEINEGLARVRTRYSGVSRGTEALVAAGGVPPGEASRMRCPFQAGDFPFPVKYGYAAVGTVEDGPAGLVGQDVFCLHPHQDRFAVPIEALHPLPEGLPPGRAVLAANMETALNGVWDASPAPGERVVVFGGGVVGLLVAWLLRPLPKVDLKLADPDPAKAAVATALGLDLCHPDALDGFDADRVIECSGNGAALAAALAAAGDEAEVTALSWYGSAPVSLPLGGPFHSRRLALRASQVGAVAPRQRPRWDHARRLRKALDLLDDPALDALVNSESAFADLPKAMPNILREGSGVLCHRVRYV